MPGNKVRGRAPFRGVFLSRTRTVPSRAAWLTRGSGVLHRTTALEHCAVSSRCIIAQKRRSRTPHRPLLYPSVRAGEEGVFFRDVLRMYDKRNTALKTDTPFPGTGVSIEACEALDALVGR